MIKQHILVELKQFIYAVTNHRGKPKNITSPQLIRSSLSLLENLPASREVVLEYFALVFDVSVSNYHSLIGKDGTSETSYEDDFINDIQEALENLVTKGPPAWSPLIASWSLELAGHLSDKYWPPRKLDIGAACNLWLNCGAMKTLLGLIASSFQKMSNAEIEICINTLLTTFRKYSLTFDWIVARLGGCFPFKIISQILQSGLKRFSEEHREGRCRLDSEIGILDYLSFAHEKDLKHAIKELLEDGFNPKSPIHIDIVPYIMHLSSLSDLLLQPIVSVFLEMYNETLLENIVRKTSLWLQNSLFRDMQPSLNNIALKIESNGTKLLLLCARLAEKFPWCQDFIEYTLQELEQVILLKRTCPVMMDLTKEDSKRLLWKSAVSTNFIEQQTAVRLLLLVSTQFQHIYHQTFAELLAKNYETNKNGIGALVRLFGGFHGVVEFPDPKPGIEMSLERIKLQKQFHCNENFPECLNAIKNLISLSKLEKSNVSPHLKHLPMNSILNECLPKLLNILDCLLNKLSIEIETANPRVDNSSNSESLKRVKMEMKTEINDNEMEIVQSPSDDGYDDKSFQYTDDDNKQIIHSIINLLNCVEAGLKTHTMGMIEVLKMAQLTVKYFFWCLTEKSPTFRASCVTQALELLQRQCSARKAARSACLRDLVEGALFLYGNLFGANDELLENEHDNISDNEKLIVLNQKQGLGPNANRSVLHAGVIGKGLKTENGIETMIEDPDPELQSLLLKAIDCCCQDQERANIVDGYSTVSLLLVEMVSPDVMYNGLPFPDEEFTKVTMERDLQIRRTFKTTPILWAILGLVASHRPALCFSSVLLRALCASFLHQWRAKNVNKFEAPGNNEELMTSTRKVLEILAMGQLLPYPLSSLHMIIHFFNASEIALILKECVWNYLKDNVPSPALFQYDPNGLHWRNPAQIKLLPQYVDTLRNLMQKKLVKLGPYYYQMFVLPEFEKKETDENI